MLFEFYFQLWPGQVLGLVLSGCCHCPAASWMHVSRQLPRVQLSSGLPKPRPQNFLFVAALQRLGFLLHEASMLVTDLYVQETQGWF